MSNYDHCRVSHRNIENVFTLDNRFYDDALRCTSEKHIYIPVSNVMYTLTKFTRTHTHTNQNSPRYCEPRVREHKK